MSLDRARFVIVPGNAGGKVAPELQPIVRGEGIAPWARVVHEQWIKHCFRDECVLNADDYLASVTESTEPEESEEPEEAEEAEAAEETPSQSTTSAEDSSDDEPTDVPPRHKLVRVQKIIKAVRDWKAGKSPGTTNYKTVYSFVDNLSSTQVS